MLTEEFDQDITTEEFFGTETKSVPIALLSEFINKTRLWITALSGNISEKEFLEIYHRLEEKRKKIREQRKEIKKSKKSKSGKSKS